MDKSISLHLLQAMIDYFEAGNQESDWVAKAILEGDNDYREIWREEIKGLQTGVDWTGLRAPEAEIVATALRNLLKLVSTEHCD